MALLILIFFNGILHTSDRLDWSVVQRFTNNYITSFVSSVQEAEREDLSGLRTFLFENLNGKLYLKEI